MVTDKMAEIDASGALADTGVEAISGRATEGTIVGVSGTITDTGGVEAISGRASEGTIVDVSATITDTGGVEVISAGAIVRLSVTRYRDNSGGRNTIGGKRVRVSIWCCICDMVFRHKSC